VSLLIAPTLHNMQEKPILFKYQELEMKEFQKKYSVDIICDSYKEQLEDIFLVRNPQFKFEKNYKNELEQFFLDQSAGGSLEELGSWFYFPWNKSLVHYLPEDMHNEVRTARNKNIINKEEQEKIYNSTIGFVGLSVGSHPALLLSTIGAAKTIKLADPDEISASNLNRIRADVSHIGLNKCTYITRQLYQINPYANIIAYEKGVTEDNLDEFLQSSPKLDVLVEEVDNLEMKIRLRLSAKKFGIPVIMATDNGDNAIVDVERYDLDTELPLFNGVAGDLSIDDFMKIKPEEMPRLATKIAGPQFITPRMQESLLEVGKSLYSWPQLITAASLSGVAVTHAVVRLLLGKKLKNGKMEVNLDSIFDPEYFHTLSVEEREDKRNKFFKIISL